MSAQVHEIGDSESEMTNTQQKPKRAILKSPVECEGDALDRVKCIMLGPDWVEIGRTYTSSLDDVTERCRRCELTRLQPKW